MPSTRFRPFHVYELNPNHPGHQILPFHYVLCLTSHEYLRHTSQVNIFVVPLLKGKAYHERDSLRLTLATKDKGGVDVPGQHSLAINIMQPLNGDLLLPHSRGHILEAEKNDLEIFVKAFLPFR